MYVISSYKYHDGNFLFPSQRTLTSRYYHFFHWRLLLGMNKRSIWAYGIILQKRLGTWCFIWHSIDTDSKRIFCAVGWREIADFHYSDFLFRKLNMKNGFKKFINSRLCSCIVEAFSCLFFHYYTRKKGRSYMTSPEIMVFQHLTSLSFI